MKDKFKTISGTLSLLGNHSANAYGTNYTIIEIIDDKGEITTLRNVIIDRTLDSYLHPGNNVELKLVEANIFNGVYSNELCIYAIKPEGRSFIAGIPGAFRKGKRNSLIWGLLCLLFFFPFSPVSVYFFWKAAKQGRALQQLNLELESI